MTSPIFIKNIISEGANFHLNRYANKRNSQFWAMGSPKIIHQASLHPLKMTFWYAIWSERIIRFYFFENENDVTVNKNV